MAIDRAFNPIVVPGNPFNSLGARGSEVFVLNTNTKAADTDADDPYEHWLAYLAETNTKVIPALTNGFPRLDLYNMIGDTPAAITQSLRVTVFGLVPFELNPNSRRLEVIDAANYIAFTHADRGKFVAIPLYSDDATPLHVLDFGTTVTEVINNTNALELVTQGVNIHVNTRGVPLVIATINQAMAGGGDAGVLMGRFSSSPR